MQIIDLQNFIAEIHAKILKRLGNQQRDTAVLMSTVKLTEEVGELSEVILQSLGRQRQEKEAKLATKDIGYEIADVILATFMLARELDIDVEKALDEKITVIQKRFKD